MDKNTSSFNPFNPFNPVADGQIEKPDNHDNHDNHSDYNTPATTKRLQSLMHIDTAFKQTRLLAIISIITSLLFAALVMIVAMKMVAKGKGKIYITNGYGNTITAYQINANQNRKAEVRAQVLTFHSLLYDITPNPTEIQKNIDKILLMGDGSVKAFIDKRGDKYYKKLVSAAVEVKYQADSVKTNLNVYPYRAVQYGREIIQTKVGILIKNLVTSMELSEVARTEVNPHGLLLSNFEVHQNKRIEFIEKD